MRRIIGGLIPPVIYIVAGLSIAIYNGIELSKVGKQTSQRFQLTIIVSLLQIKDMNNVISKLNRYRLTGDIKAKHGYFDLAKITRAKQRELNIVISAPKSNHGTKKIDHIIPSLKEYIKIYDPLIHLKEHCRVNFLALTLTSKTMGFINMRNLKIVDKLLLKKEKVKQVESLTGLNELRYTWIQMMNSLRTSFNVRSLFTMK